MVLVVQHRFTSMRTQDQALCACLCSGKAYLPTALKNVLAPQKSEGPARKASAFQLPSPSNLPQLHQQPLSAIDGDIAHLVKDTLQRLQLLKPRQRVIFIQQLGGVE